VFLSLETAWNILGMGLCFFLSINTWQDISEILIEIASSARILLVIATIIKKSRISMIRTPRITEIIKIIIVIPLFLILSNNKS
jgi:hypothetical protein